MNQPITDPGEPGNNQEIDTAPLETIGAQLTTVIDQIDALQRRNNHVRIVDFNMPFFALVGILVKIALASIPAMIIVAITLSIIGIGVSAALAAFSIGATSFLRASRDPLLLATPTTDAPVVIPAAPNVVPEPTSTLAPTATPEPYDLVLIRVDDQSTNTGHTVTGAITNRGLGSSPAAVVVISFENRATGVVSKLDTAIGSLAPGQTADFTVTNPDAGDWAYTIDLTTSGLNPQLLKYRDAAP